MNPVRSNFWAAARKARSSGGIAATAARPPQISARKINKNRYSRTIVENLNNPAFERKGGNRVKGKHSTFNIQRRTPRDRIVAADVRRRIAPATVPPPYVGGYEGRARRQDLGCWALNVECSPVEVQAVPDFRIRVR